MAEKMRARILADKERVQKRKERRRLGAVLDAPVPECSFDENILTKHLLKQGVS